jgi:hypothetical protein
MDKIQEIRTALAAATPGPWEVVDTGSINIAKNYRKNGDKHIAHWIAEMDVQDESEEHQAYSDADLIANAPSYISYLLQQIEIKDKALKEAETFVEELILAADTVPASHLDLEEIAKDGTDVINSIAAALKGEDTSE